MHRLLDHDDTLPQFAQRRINCCCLPKLAECLEVPEVFIAIQGDGIFSTGYARKKTTEFTQPRFVALCVREEFDLEIPEAVFANLTFQILRQAIVHSFA